MAVFDPLDDGVCAELCGGWAAPPPRPARKPAIGVQTSTFFFFRYLSYYPEHEEVFAQVRCQHRPGDPLGRCDGCCGARLPNQFMEERP